MPSAILFQDSIWQSVVMYLLLIALFQVPSRNLFSNVFRWVLSLFELPVCPVDNDDADGGSADVQVCLADDDDDGGDSGGDEE